MNYREILTNNFVFTHQILSQTVEGLTLEQLHHRSEGSSISSMMSIYAHTVFSEDNLLHGMLQGKPTLFETGGWASKINAVPSGGLSDDDWRDAIDIDDLDSFNAYREAVLAALVEYVTNVSDGELDRIFQTPFGEHTVGWVLNNFIAWHTIQHTGELCALKGLVGQKGLPF